MDEAVHQELTPRSTDLGKASVGTDWIDCSTYEVFPCCREKMKGSL